jgi:hypothetical protein
MKVELRLKQVLQEHDLYRHGIEKQMAEGCKVHRHTIGKLLHNRAKNPSLKVLGKVCKWLVDHGVPAEKLPQALFGFRTPELWTAFGNAKKVAIYQGAYAHNAGEQNEIQSQSLPQSISRHDAVVVGKIMSRLSSKEHMGETRPGVEPSYVPFHFSLEPSDVSGPGFEEDKKLARVIFEEMKRKEGQESAILVGSQRVNYLVECLVADLFGCRPFEPVEKEPKVPFYLCYRDSDRPVPSCFGGRSGPPGLEGAPRPGTYYINEDGKWELIEWKQNEQDAGVVIVSRQADSVVLAAFGFSGLATCALGTELIDHGEQVWPDHANENDSGKKGKEARSEPTVTKKDKEIGVYLFCLKFFEKRRQVNSSTIKDCDEFDAVALPLGGKVLEKYLH